ncbi:MAG: 16S rRNA (uracil(1498)-N(3))-methyltransferase [Armatimonadetes bacterium]|nr:16S rRNA (uracil(1498)-N(3))-methyltransferase [Armatimonadota bacterium]
MSRLRALPRAFVEIPGLDPSQPILIPELEMKKFRSVLRLGSGDQVLLLPGDGSAIRCRLDGKSAIPLETVHPSTESPLKITLALGLPKPDALEDSVRMASELGVAKFCLFPARRSVVKWEASKFEKKLERLRAISREACEVAYRMRLPEFETCTGLGDVLARYPGSVVLSESETAQAGFPELAGEAVLVVGPEGGWDPQESEMIKNPVTLGPRVLRVGTAVAAACTLALSGR